MYEERGYEMKLRKRDIPFEVASASKLNEMNWTSNQIMEVLLLHKENKVLCGVMGRRLSSVYVFWNGMKFWLNLVCNQVENYKYCCLYWI